MTAVQRCSRPRTAVAELTGAPAACGVPSFLARDATERPPVKTVTSAEDYKARQRKTFAVGAVTTIPYNERAFGESITCRLCRLKALSAFTPKVSTPRTRFGTATTPSVRNCLPSLKGTNTRTN
ncbi:hypothetical protein KPB2_5343 [Klebsiella pneumoniae Kb677]|nr:hypothetical protein KPB2_5343 [Klebsiella pneumoniae Kb677]